MRTFDPERDPVLQQLRDRRDDLDARRRRHELDSRTGHGQRDPDLSWERMVDRHRQIVHGQP